MKEIVQDPRDCVYAQFFGENITWFDPDTLTIIRRAQLSGGSFDVDVAIIGESHFVRVFGQNGQFVFAELLACVDLEEMCCVPDQTIQMTERGRRVIGATLLKGVVAAVETNVALQSDEPAWLDVDSTVNNYPSTGAHLWLSFEFPGEHKPRTVVFLNVAESNTDVVLSISTLHEYVGGDDIERLVTTTTLTLRQ